MSSFPYSIPNIGESLRAARLGAGLSQAELAKRARLTQAQVSLFERGGDLRLSTLMLLAGALDIELALIPRRAASLVKEVVKSVPAP